MATQERYQLSPSSLQECSEEEVTQYASHAHFVVTDPDIRRVLRARGRASYYDGHREYSLQRFRGAYADPASNGHIHLYSRKLGDSEDSDVLPLPEGFGKVNPNQSLKRQRIPGTFPGLLRVMLPLMEENGGKLGAYVSGWADILKPGDTQAIIEDHRFIYDHLKDKANEANPNSPPWTLEPKASPSWMHTVLQESGFVPVQSGLYELNGTSHNEPLQSNFLYIASTVEVTKPQT